MKKHILLSIITKLFLFAFLIVLSGIAPGNIVKALPVTVSCSGTAGSPTAVDEASLFEDDVTFSDGGGDGYCEIDASISAASVLVNPNVVLTHPGEDSDGVTITTTGNFTIDVNASINVDEKGCADSTGDAHGYGPNDSNVCTYNTNGAGQGGTAAWQGGGGGGYGGYGGAGKTGLAGGTYYTDSADTNYDNPVLFGSSGGTTEQRAGGTGGGLVILNVGGTLSHAGTITADGGNGVIYGGGGASGGGSGGAINITAAKVTGSGTFSADGGAGANNSGADGGGGAGGRIFIKYTDDTTKTFSSSDFSATGGSGPDDAIDGGNGTVHVEDTDVDEVNIFYGYIYNRDISVTSWAVDSSATDQVCDGASDATPSITTTGALTLAGAIDCTHSSITGFDTAAGTSITVSSLTFSMNGLDATKTVNLWTMNDNVPVTVTGSTINSNLNWTNLASLSFDGSTTVNANERGCQDVNSDPNGYGPNGSNVCSHNGNGAGSGTNGFFQGGGGAGHGGSGGTGETGISGGSTYDTQNSPTMIGASGGTSGVALGGHGAGLVILDVNGDFVQNGAINADGGNGAINGGGETGGGGSGGSISIVSRGIFSGTTGSFSADGGDGGNLSGTDGGGGGGGRIYVGYGTDSSSYLAGLAASSVAIGGSGPDAATDGNIGTLSKVQVVNLTSSTITDNSGYTSDATPEITIVESGATPTDVAFSCNNSDWSTWISYPDDDVVNDGDGPVFDITTGATGCTTAEGSKTIYAKIKDGNGESSVVSDTTVYDATGPSGLGTFISTDAEDTAITFTWTASSDTNFSHYEIWYGSTLTDVQGRTGGAVEWDNGDDANLATAGTTTTTITGVSLGDKFYKIWAVDSAGNSETVTNVYVSIGGSQSPNVYAPTNLTVEDHEDGVKLSWEDPTDGEANKILIHRGVEPYSVSGSYYAAANMGVEYYIDTDVEEGDVVTYMLRGNNGNTYSSYSSGVVFVVGSTLPEEDVDTGSSPEGDSPDTTEDEKEEEVNEEVKTLDELGLDPPDHWSSGYFANLNEYPRVLQDAENEPLFFNLMEEMVEMPNEGMNRGKALQFLITLADYTVDESEVDTFTDVDEAHELGYMIEFAADNDLIEGYSDGSFGPEDVVNRAEALKMCAYFFGFEYDEVFGDELLALYELTENPFIDVNLDLWYAPHVIFAYANSVVQGYQDGTNRFGAANDVTYAEFVKIATLMKDFENAIELASELE